MKKFLVLVITLGLTQFAYAADTANIKLKISGPITDNRYFVCEPDVGCLSILAAKNGKVYQIMRDVDMNTLFVMDATNRPRVYSQGLPTSCNVDVKTGQTITIYGNLSKNANGVRLNNLRCAVS